MSDYYAVPTIVILAVAAGVFWAVYRRYRSNRALLWCVGWICVLIRLVLDKRYPDLPPGSPLTAVADCALLMGGLMFISSTAPLNLGRRFRLPWVVLLALPVLTFAIWQDLVVDPGRFSQAGMFICALVSTAVAIFWARAMKGAERAASAVVVLLTAVPCLFEIARGDYGAAGLVLLCGIFSAGSVLFAFAYRRWSPGVILSSCALFAWGQIFSVYLVFWRTDQGALVLTRISDLFKIVSALGMTILVLEQELHSNTLAKDRESRMRLELERYATMRLWLAPSEDISPLCNSVCQAVTKSGIFSQAAVLLRTEEGAFCVCGHAGMDGGQARAIDALARKSGVEFVRAALQSEPLLPSGRRSRVIDLRTFFAPGDELERFAVGYVTLIPLCGQAEQQSDEELKGALLLLYGAADKPTSEFDVDDMLPLEILASNLGLAMDNRDLVERLGLADKLSGLGKLAGGIAHELNNPLTVVQGYSELMKDSEHEATRRQATIIHQESQRMKQIIEGMTRFWRPGGGHAGMVQISQLLKEVIDAQRKDLDSKGIAIDFNVLNRLPLVAGNSERLRQAFLQLLNNAREAIERSPGEHGQIRIEASTVNGRVHLMVCDSGPGFAQPKKAFDPFYTTKEPGSGPGLGLSVCYGIVREHRGEISAFNLHPHGAAVVIELPVAEIALPRQTREWPVIG